MAKERRKIGVIFSYNENWIGGTYFISNLIEALQSLQDDHKPDLVIFVDNDHSQREITKIKYPYIQFAPINFNYSFSEKAINKIARLFTGKNIIVKTHPTEICEAVFPYNMETSLQKIQKKTHWIPDLQEHFLTHFFNKEELGKRSNYQQKLIENKLPIIFSSKDSKNKFREIYPEAKNQAFVVNFAVTHPEYQQLPIDDLKLKYGINKPYLMAPNQFWKHKNHIVILEAVKKLIQPNPDFLIVLTGKEHDFRNPTCILELKEFADKNRLINTIKFLGFIERSEQLQLMNHALAIIQPSLFEGWSTVVEDAKAMSQFIIASDLEVHREQLESYPNKIYFQPNDSTGLSKLIDNQLTNPAVKIPFNYHQNIAAFAKHFLEVVER